MSFTPHLCVPDRGGFSRPLLGGGLGYPGPLVPAGPTQSRSQGGCQVVADPRGEVEAGLEAHEQRGRGAVPEAAAAVSGKGERQKPSGSEGKSQEKPCTKHNNHQLNPR